MSRLHIDSCVGVNTTNFGYDFGMNSPETSNRPQRSTVRDDAGEKDSVFAIDPSSPAPPFRQLHDRIVAAVAAGRLTPGQQLPTVRALAAAQGLAPNTVAKAYKSLEAAGVIEGRGRAGTFVSAGDDPVESAARAVAIRAAAEFRGLGIEVDRAERLLREAFGAAQLSAGPTRSMRIAGSPASSEAARSTRPSIAQSRSPSGSSST